VVESLRATGMAGEPPEFFQYLPTTGRAPQRREWFGGAKNESMERQSDQRSDEWVDRYRADAQREGLPT
jgi:trehalose 2-sulfotransferase